MLCSCMRRECYARKRDSWCTVHPLRVCAMISPLALTTWLVLLVSTFLAARCAILASSSLEKCVRTSTVRSASC